MNGPGRNAGAGEVGPGMEYEPTVTPILAAGALGIVFAVLAALVFIESPWGEPAMAVVHRHAQHFMLGIALTATLGSLFYSEVVGYLPCEFCWFQRIMMYPLALLLLVSVVTRRRLEPRFIVALAAVGLPISIYHFQLQLFPEQAQVCAAFAPCSVKEFEEFGFITIPFMAGAAFLSVLLLQVAEWRVDALYRRWSAGEAGEPAEDFEPPALGRALTP
jgi:disulfide bond formation protein DsbB